MAFKKAESQQEKTPERAAPSTKEPPIVSPGSLVTSVGSMGKVVTPITRPEKGPLPTTEAHTVLLWGEGDILTPVSVMGPPRSREIMVDGVPYDHVDTTNEGTWIYRNDRKN